MRNKNKCYVWMRKRDAQLCELLPTIFGGWGLAFIDLDSPEARHQIAGSNPEHFIFDDSPLFKPGEYIQLGEL